MISDEKLAEILKELDKFIEESQEYKLKSTSTLLNCHEDGRISGLQVAKTLLFNLGNLMISDEKLAEFVNITQDTQAYQLSKILKRMNSFP